MIKNFLKKILSKNKIKFLSDLYFNIRPKYIKSYAQSGEDIIINFLFKNLLNIKTPSYLDIGAHHGSFLSNTYLLYKNGSRGVLVEPDPILFKKLQKSRKKDICLNVGVGVSILKEADFYIFNHSVLNTFLKEEVEVYDKSIKLEKIIKVPLININEIIEKNFKTCPDFISIDTEGLDFEILKSLNFDKYRPKVFCIETLSHNSRFKNIVITDFLNNLSYILYGDTYLNSIYVDKNLF